MPKSAWLSAGSARIAAMRSASGPVVSARGEVWRELLGAWAAACTCRPRPQTRRALNAMVRGSKTMPRSVAKKLGKGAQPRVVPSGLRRHESHFTMAAAVADPRVGQAHARDGRREYYSRLVQRRRPVSLVP